MRRHPVGLYVFVWSCDAVALCLGAWALWHAPEYSRGDWIQFAVWTCLLTVAHLGVINFPHVNFHYGWFVAIDFAAAMSLPFSLFCLTMATWFLLTVVKRLWQRHPEPLLGPDFNAANVTMDAFLACLVYASTRHLLQGYGFADTVALMVAAATFIGVQNMLVTILLSLDLRKHWRKVGVLTADTLLSDGMMVTAGAVVSRIFQFDPYLLVLTVMVLLFLHATLQQLHEAKLAYVDAKTGLHNYRYFDETLADSFRKATQSREPLALIFGDMDHLRDINNTYGHLSGDRALVAVAKGFGNASGDGAVACRFGGEEFVLMIPGFTKAQAAVLAEQVRQSIAATPVTLDCGTVIAVSVSMGVAAYPEDADSVEALVKAADEAVYDSKHAGRNRVSLYGPCKAAAAANSGGTARILILCHT